MSSRSTSRTKRRTSRLVWSTSRSSARSTIRFEVEAGDIDIDLEDRGLAKAIPLRCSVCPTSTVSGSVSRRACPRRPTGERGEQGEIIRELEFARGTSSTWREQDSTPRPLVILRKGADDRRWCRTACASVRPLVAGARMLGWTSMSNRSEPSPQTFTYRGPRIAYASTARAAGPGAHHGLLMMPHVHQAGACARGARPPRDRGRHARPRSLDQRATWPRIRCRSSAST